jgi:hypothetical protein
MTIPNRETTRLEVVECFDDDLGWLVQRTLRDSVAGAEPPAAVWQRVRQEVTAQPVARQRFQDWARRLYRFLNPQRPSWAEVHSAMKRSTARRQADLNLYMYLVGAPSLLEPQSQFWFAG